LAVRRVRLGGSVGAACSSGGAMKNTAVVGTVAFARPRPVGGSTVAGASSIVGGGSTAAGSDLVARRRVLFAGSGGVCGVSSEIGNSS
jgi:hypothetical protein